MKAFTPIRGMIELTAFKNTDGVYYRADEVDAYLVAAKQYIAELEAELAECKRVCKEQGKAIESLAALEDE